MKKWLGRVAALGLVAMLSGLFFIGAVYADDTLQSPHYQLEESTIGSGGLVNSSSPNYQSNEAIGDTAVGNSSSSNFQINAGNKTTPDPALTFGVNNTNANFGNFSPDTTATANASFSVSDYTSYGYAVQLVGSPPSYEGHTISPIATNDGGGQYTASPQIGVDQFGINLVANTIPKVFGTNPDQGQFGKGVAETHYSVPNQYRYVSGETIATSPKSSGVTTFTISYIVNVGHLDPGGEYTSSQSVVCTGTF